MQLQKSPMILTAVACALAGAQSVCAQWSDDPAVNTPLVTAANDQVQPKVAVTADGGAYVSWFDNRVGGHDVYLQRINAAGEAQWQADGILIADRSFSSTQDYDLDVDSAGYAVVAFRDDRLGGVVVTASRVAPDGTQVWGAGGVQPSMTGSSIGHIRVAALSDGGSVIGWHNGSAARVVKLDAAGNEQWSTDIGSAPAGTFTVSDLVASGSDVIVVMTTFGGFITPRNIYAQKLDADGDTAWAAPVPIHTVSSIQIGNFPGAISDGNGGMVMAWYHTSPLTVLAQHVDGDGVVQFPAGGAEVSTNAAQLRVSPSVAYDPVSGSTYVFWNELTGLQAALGVYGQRLDAAGNRQWSDDGLAILSTANETTQVSAVVSGEGAQVFFAERLSPTSQRLLGANLDADGNFVWQNEVATTASSKSRLNASGAGSQTLLFWEDDRNGNADLFAQNVNADGSLGGTAPSIPGDLNGDGIVNVGDLLLLLSDWGPCPGCDADLNGDDQVNVGDMLILLGNWG